MKTEQDKRMTTDHLSRRIAINRDQYRRRLAKQRGTVSSVLLVIPIDLTSQISQVHQREEDPAGSASPGNYRTWRERALLQHTSDEHLV